MQRNITTGIIGKKHVGPEKVEQFLALHSLDALYWCMGEVQKEEEKKLKISNLDTHVVRVCRKPADPPTVPHG